MLCDRCQEGEATCHITVVMNGQSRQADLCNNCAASTLPWAGTGNHSAPKPARPGLVKKSKWPDFLFTVAVRFVTGIFLGCLACIFFDYKGILSAFSRNNTRVPLILLAACGVVGGIIAVLTTPRWQTPWYEGIRFRGDGER